MLPAIVVIIPVILMFRVAGLSGSYIGIILLYTAFNLAFTIWMMKSFFDELSLDVEDAARIDGSSEIKVFFKICLPRSWRVLPQPSCSASSSPGTSSFCPRCFGHRHAHRAGRHEPGGLVGGRGRLDAAGPSKPCSSSCLPRHLLPAESSAAWCDLRNREALICRQSKSRKSPNASASSPP
jgi:hypothetical protein